MNLACGDKDRRPKTRKQTQEKGKEVKKKPDNLRLKSNNNKH